MVDQFLHVCGHIVFQNLFFYIQHKHIRVRLVLGFVTFCYFVTLLLCYFVTSLSRKGEKITSVADMDLCHSRAGGTLPPYDLFYGLIFMALSIGVV